MSTLSLPLPAHRRLAPALAMLLLMAGMLLLSQVKMSIAAKPTSG